MSLIWRGAGAENPVILVRLVKAHAPLTFQPANYLPPPPLRFPDKGGGFCTSNMKCGADNGGLSMKTSPWKNVESGSLKPQCVKAINFNLNDDVKPSSDKENQDGLSSGPHDGLFDSESTNVQEDSGYLSLHNSHIEHDEQDSVAADPCGQWQDERGSVSVQAVEYSCETSQSHPSLPQLQFQQTVCRHLAEGYKKTKRFDLTAIRFLAKGSGLQKVIGGKMGLDYVDVLQMLWEKDMKHILTKILRLLGDTDLIKYVFMLFFTY